jgi:hypothetical protein
MTSVSRPEPGEAGESVRVNGPVRAFVRDVISTRYDSTPPKQISSPSRTWLGDCVTASWFTVVPLLLSRSAT